MAKKFSSFKGHQLITESWRSFINESETGSPAGRNASAQDSEMELEEMSKAEADAMRGYAGQYRVLPGGGIEPISQDAESDEDMKKAEEDAMRGYAGQYKVLPGGGIKPLEERKFTDEQQKEFNELVSSGIPHSQAEAIVTGGPEKKAKYEKMLKTTSRTKALRFVYGAPYSPRGR